MKLIAAILVAGMTVGPVSAQNPNIITNTKNKLDTAQRQKTADSNAALGIADAHPAKSPYSASKAASAPVRADRAGQHQISASTKPSSHKAGKVAGTAPAVAVENAATSPDSAQPEEPQAIHITGRRDPFISPVVSRAMTGSGCSTGKRCLAIDQINLRGVVKSDEGMIAVVVNALDKAYFLHENDPVFNGYVVRITGDSVIFKESVQDKFGKPFTREVTKKIFTPAV
jgi:hypothetical protein